MSTDLTTIRAELEQAQALSEKATGAPWHYQPWSTYALPSGDYAESILLSNDSPDGEVIRGLTDEDGELIAAYRSLTPKLIRVVLAVLDRHRKSPLFDHEDGCENTSEEHREEKHVEWSMGEFYCEDLHAGWTCRHCYEVQDIDSLGEPPAWPCSTVQDLIDAMGGQDDG